MPRYRIDPGRPVPPEIVDRLIDAGIHPVETRAEPSNVTKVVPCQDRKRLEDALRDLYERCQKSGVAPKVFRPEDRFDDLPIYACERHGCVKLPLGAPVILAVCFEPRRYPGVSERMARDSSVAVAGMVCGALFHRAAERGLEFTITGPFGQDQELDRRLGLTGGWECLFLIGIGYPTEETY